MSPSIPSAVSGPRPSPPDPRIPPQPEHHAPRSHQGAFSFWNKNPRAHANTRLSKKEGAYGHSCYGLHSSDDCIAKGSRSWGLSTRAIVGNWTGEGQSKTSRQYSGSAVMVKNHTSTSSPPRNLASTVQYAGIGHSGPFVRRARATRIPVVPIACGLLRSFPLQCGSDE